MINEPTALCYRTTQTAADRFHFHWNDMSKSSNLRMQEHNSWWPVIFCSTIKMHPLRIQRVGFIDSSWWNKFMATVKSYLCFSQYHVLDNMQQHLRYWWNDRNSRVKYSFTGLLTPEAAVFLQLEVSHLAALRYMRRSQSLTPGIQTSSSFSVTAWPQGEGKGCSSGSLA